MDTPRETLFSFMYDQWGVSNKELARALVLRESATAGKPPIELIETRSTLSRFVVHAQPGENVHGWLAPYEETVPRVIDVVKRSKMPHSSADIVTALKDEGVGLMRASFDACGGDGALFANVADRAGGGEFSSAADSAEALLGLFVVAGCSGSAREAARFTLDRMRRFAMQSELRTRVADEKTRVPEEGSVQMALYPMRDGLLVGSPHPLFGEGDGTEIGSMSLSEHSINVTGAGVSRRHARVWRDVSGTWWVEGLGSTNGTVVVRESGARKVVEPSRDARRKGASCGKVAVSPGDRLVLAGTTELAFVAIA